MIAYLNNWMLFSISFGLMLMVTLFMSALSQQFYTCDVVVKKFSIMELELPASAQELVNIISGIFKLPAAQSQKTLHALKGQLYIDFLFMPLAYGSVFLLCWKVAAKSATAGHIFFMALAALQAVAWLCDIIENIYLLQKIKPHPALTSAAGHQNYLMMEVVKWGSSLLATVCGISCVFYFWVSGQYSLSALHWLLVVLAEIVVFILLQMLVLKNARKAAAQ